MSLRLLTKRSVFNQVKVSSGFVARRAVVPLVSCRLNSTVAEPAATGAAATPVDPKISKIVEEISKLTLLETSSLIKELKTQLDIPDIAMPVAGVAAAPAGGAAAEEAAAEEEKPQEKSVFGIKLESFDAKSKPKIIKEIKNLLGLSLVEAKKFVEAAPKLLKENVAKDEAEKIKTTLEGLGGKVTLE
ncbi:hypothetical protein Kpol_1002p54 [Vanderwaltozyma polyspora DSM 70294]|uniref:Ribosomal protein L7/L12 C-terminal domain-containing protein n=1 Tax=Vanderwaltozyma polyspora (strain ATCC 22028 / DSM 70294 / BCRC 21397 / CBS 2163 / NBRC 10782 / NRRL Y-8283 / UCD 57-17) TaxID=436907 RepID=A7TE85_VANPO|nr:uncharacterized protein Kpol_1002p54 [Vanderwaltozyma polyspora DSM 70294]EDO19407.1 hypothetical protein Kpol_1002p54 [Vanderwaltozyma polyspora DSM 70294]